MGFQKKKDSSQEHILGFATCFYDYILVKKDICNY